MGGWVDEKIKGILWILNLNQNPQNWTRKKLSKTNYLFEALF
jgi:hypothetical protein